MRAHVLVVDDDPDGREVTGLLLRELGYEVTTTSSSEEALQYLYSEEMCDAVLADIVMPGMWGDKFALRSREARPGVPVILMSGNPMGCDSALSSGSLALMKPVSLERLRAVLDEALEVGMGPRRNDPRFGGPNPSA